MDNDKKAPLRLQVPLWQRLLTLIFLPITAVVLFLLMIIMIVSVLATFFLALFNPEKKLHGADSVRKPSKAIGDFSWD